MRHVLRYLPAFLALLIPLAVLAFLGSRELSRQQDRAETFLREGAYDFLARAAQRLDAELDKYFNALLGTALEMPHANLTVLARELRQSHPELPELVELVVLNSDFWLEHPPPPPDPRNVLGGRRSGGPAATARMMWWLGDEPGAIEKLEKLRAEASEGEVPGWAELQLAAILRGRGEKDRAYAVLSEALAQLEAGAAPDPEPQRSRRSAETTLLIRTGHAELHLELSRARRDASELVALLGEIGDDGFEEVGDDLLTAVFDRVAARVPEHAAAVAAAQHAFAELLEGRRHARELASRALRRLRTRLLSAKESERIHQVWDTDLATHLLVMRAALPAETEHFHAQWVGIWIDLTALANRVLVPGDDVFHLDVLNPDGMRVMRHPQPEGADDWQQEVLSRATVAGMQLHAIPRDARQQLEDRRAFTRNTALLWLALCLVAGGGALFLVRSVGREAELAAMKVDLVSRVSHELRTPLAMIKMYGDTLEMGRTKDQQQASQFAHVISREADRLTLLIDRILDFSRQQSGEITYRKEPVDAAELIEDVAEEYRRHVESAGFELVTELEHGMRVHVDHETMRSAVVNLIENALKYTAPSAPSRAVELTLHQDGENAVLEVKDRGIGVPPGERRRIFESFYRASNAGEARGAGIGLSLVKHFVEAHGGTIEASARAGGGTVFRMSLPLLAAEDGKATTT